MSADPGRPSSSSRHAFQTDDGLEIRVRPEEPGDAEYLVDLFEHMSSTSRYMRFQRVLDDPDPELVRREAQRLAGLRPPTDNAWIAFADLPGAPDAPVAGARYVRTSPDTAELAISVRDDLQRRGIGSQLLNFVLNEARRDGITRLTATFRSDNQAIWALLRYSPFHVTWEQAGVEVNITIHLLP